MDTELLIKKLDKGEDLSQEEIGLLEENKDKLSESEKAKLVALTGEEIDTDSLGKIIDKSVDEKLEAKAEAMANSLVDRMIAKAEKQRSKILGEEKDEKADNTVREFMKALVGGDKEKLLVMQRKTATFNEYSDNARGGYLVPTVLFNEVMRILESGYGVARSSMRYLPFTGAGNSRPIPTLASSVTTYWVNEAVAKTASNPTFGLVTQTLKKLACIVPFTDELVEDSATNFTQLIAELFAEAVAKEEDTQFFVGTGSPWTGILNNGSVNLVTLGAGEDIADITADDLLDMQDNTPAGALGGAAYYLHRHALSYIRKLKDQDDNYIYQAPSAGLPGTIWNYPYVLCEALPNKTTGAAASKGIMAFGNLKQAAVIGDKQQIRVKLLDQATVTDGDGSTVLNLAEQDMSALRLMERVGYLLALPTAVTVLKTGVSS